MITNFTPGPWFSVAPKEIKHIFINSDNGVICRIINEVSKNPLTIEDEANASLIAAAPDLYNALETLTKYCEIKGIPTDAAYAALAKARGEAVTEANPLSIDQIKSELTTGTVSLENYLRHNFDIYRKVK